MKKRKDFDDIRVHKAAIFLTAVFLCLYFFVSPVWAAKEESIQLKYQEYQKRFNSVQHQNDLFQNGFVAVRDQIFPIEIAGYGEASLIPAFDQTYHRLALFFVDARGRVLFRTDQLETNYCVLGELKQPDCEIAAIAIKDLNQDGCMDLILITEYKGVEGFDEDFKIGDVLFQNKQQTGFYRDYRIADKINRFGMNKSAEVITAFVRDGYSTEFLYTSTTLKELLGRGFQIISEQCHFRIFGKLGRLQVVPGTYPISNYDVFMIYLVNEQGDILFSFQPMGNYDNLYALKGINCRDIDGDGLKDIVVLAKYSYEGDEGELIVESDYSVYYQRTGSFSPDTEIKRAYPCGEEDTMEQVIEKTRAYWGFQVEKDD